MTLEKEAAAAAAARGSVRYSIEYEEMISGEDECSSMDSLKRSYKIELSLFGLETPFTDTRIFLGL